MQFVLSPGMIAPGMMKANLGLCWDEVESSAKPFDPEQASPALREAMIKCGFLDAPAVDPEPVSHHIVCVRQASVTRFLCACQAVDCLCESVATQCSASMSVVGGVA